MKHKVTALITGVGGGGLGEQLIKALRLSKQVEYHIVGTDITRFSKGLEEVDVAEVVPSASHPDYIPTLLKLCEERGVQVVFPGSEPELKIISLARDQFAEKSIFLPINTQEVLNICFDKFKTVNFLKSNGFKYPQSVRVQNEADLAAIDFYPVVLKPSIGGSGSANIMLAQTPKELILFGTYLLQSFDEFIVQEYVGTPDHEYTVGVLCSMEGEVINSIAIKRIITHGLGSKMKVKNRTGKTELGTDLVISSGISQGDIGRFELVTEVCRKIAKAIGAKSAINIQCRYHRGEVYVFEINPRYSGTTSLRAMVGYNEPDVMVRKYLLGESVDNDFAYEQGTILRGLSEVLIN